jgi:glycine cleavage system H protein
MKIVEGLFYSKEHEWVKVDGNTATIGVTDYAQDQLGDIVFVELPMEDDEFAQDDVFGVVESVKAASDLFIPVSGVVLEANLDLEDAPEQVNEDPYGSWMIKIELSDENELESLMNAAQYKEFCENL